MLRGPMRTALAGHFPDLPRRPAAAPPAQKILRTRAFVGGSPRKNRRAELTPGERELAEAIARTYGVSVDGMLSRSRIHMFAVPRDCFIATLRRSTNLSLPDLGALLGRDHSSIHEAIRRHEARLSEEP